MTEAKLLYMDASAFVKLVLPEPETAALAADLGGAARLVASAILEVEVLRAVRRAAGDDLVPAARAQLDGMRLLPVSDEIRRRASQLEPDTLRTLDAIHIATALDLGERLESMYVYDTRMAAAAAQAGLHVQAPGAATPAGGPAPVVA